MDTHTSVLFAISCTKCYLSAVRLHARKITHLYGISIYQKFLLKILNLKLVPMKVVYIIKWMTTTISLPLSQVVGDLIICNKDTKVVNASLSTC